LDCVLILANLFSVSVRFRRHLLSKLETNAPIRSLAIEEQSICKALMVFPMLNDHCQALMFCLHSVAYFLKGTFAEDPLLYQNQNLTWTWM